MLQLILIYFRNNCGTPKKSGVTSKDKILKLYKYVTNAK